MKYYSTRNTKSSATFREATLAGLAPDGGLYMPEEIPTLTQGTIESLRNVTLPEIAFHLGLPYVKDDIPEAEYQELVERAITFDAPLIRIDDDLAILELFHGPTLAFKDFGARFMAECMSWFIRNDDQKLTVLVATSGDTGGAVAAGFLGVPGIEVIILYPSGKVSRLQEQQLTTNGANITALEIDGTFDDCQRLVKEAFQDRELNTRRRLTSANSINISRLIPQMFYYARGFTQLSPDSKKPTFCVPSGNFGNLTAGVFAQKMGIPIEHFIAATNQNKVIPDYLSTGHYDPKPSVKTLSNAMDVGSPSNYERLVNLFEEDHAQFCAHMIGCSIDDPTTTSTIVDLKEKANYIACPHTAVGIRATREAGRSNSIVLATAHPAKFIDVMPEEIAKEIEIPQRLQDALDKEKKSIPLGSDYAALKEYLTTTGR